MALSCLPALRCRWEAQGLRLLPYQVATAETIVDGMDGQGILADEVGLGKTIEAGLVASELMARQRCRTMLVLCPAPLTSQWQRELSQKFGLRLAVNLRPEQWATTGRLIASIDQAKREPARAALLGRQWDLVVVDEAHKLKNRQTQNHQFVAGLRRRFLLLLSATPLQNDLTELYSLVSLVRPGLFGSFPAFWREFLLDRRTPKDPAALRRILAQVMVRHRRTGLEREQGAQLPQRQVALLPLSLSAAERQLYDGVTQAIREEYWRRVRGEGSVLPLLTLQREVCSSAAAVRRTLQHMETGEWIGPEFGQLRALADAVQDQTKAQVLGGLAGELRERVLVFTEFRATQEFLRTQLEVRGIPVLLLHGAQDRASRDRALQRFAAEPRAVLISTESGGQGLNLQFCHNLVNYDLPWNPMRVEQRIGRVHRLGQRQDVYIYNLYAEQTVEEHLLHLLDTKIHLFQQVIGELDVILRRLEKGGRRTLESRIAEILWTSRDGREMGVRFEDLGRQFLWQRRLVREREAALAGAASADG